MAVLLWACSRKPADLFQHRLTVDGMRRTYQLYVPPGLDPEVPAPLVVALHAFTQTGAAMARMTGFNEVAAREGFIVAYPDGLRRRFNYDGSGSPDDRRFVLAVIDHVAGVRSIDRRRVYLTGASNGGFLTYALACEGSGIFAAVAPVMASMPASIADACADGGPPLPVLIIHGTADRIVPYDAATVNAGPTRQFEVLPIPETAASWAARNGHAETPVEEQLPDTDPGDGTRVTRFTWDGPPGSGETVLLRVDGGGHTWPGDTSSLPEFIVGKTSMDIDASEVIWAFFARHVLPAPQDAGEASRF